MILRISVVKRLKQQIKDLQDRNYLLKEENKLLKSKLGKDPLTGLVDYRSSAGKRTFEIFFNRCKREQNLSKGSNLKCWVVFIDLMRFKDINDKYGHDVGDSVIEAVAGSLVQSLRSYDVRATFDKNWLYEADKLTRAGGDEFILGLENLSEQDIPKVFRRIVSRYRSIIRESDLKDKENLVKMIGFNFGASSMNESFEDIQQWVSEADRIMYKAKQHAHEKISYSGGEPLNTYVVDNGDVATL